MWFDYFSVANCKNCYACVRVCPVNAIEIKNEQARIIQERCIVCDQCFNACPKKHKVLSSEIPTIKSLVKENNDVVVSIAPSFSAIWGENSDKLPNVLKSLGFKAVEESLVAAKPILEEYYKYLNKDDDENYITTLCPTIVNLIEKHYPDLIKNLIPSISVFLCHGKMIKEKYGKETKVACIGSCLGKKDEGRNENCIDAVITFEELKRWLKKEKISWENYERSPLDKISNYKSVYPFLWGNKEIFKDRPIKKELAYIDGIEDCIQVLKAIRRKKVSNTVFEMNFCINGCIGGTGINPMSSSSYERKLNLKKYSEKYKKDIYFEDNNSYDEITKNIDLRRTFKSRYKPLKNPTDKQMKEILKTMGMFSKSDEINCKACGYSSCREKAKAIFNNLADSSMCLPYLRKNAENKANVLFNITPNLIAIIDDKFSFQELNPAALKFFRTTKEQIKNNPVSRFLDEEKFKKVKENQENIIRKRSNIKNPKSIIVENIIWIASSQIFIWIANDITEEEKQKEELQFMKVDAVNMAQNVINKQMEVAQEIASLLGETTAETKVTLTKLKELIDEEGK